MAKNKSKQTERPAVITENGIVPLFAIHTIIYGNAQTAPSESIFTPVSAEERQFLLNAGAARELNDTEKAVFGLKSDAPPAGDDKTNDDQNPLE